MYKVQKLTEARKMRLLNQDEGHFLDFKAIQIAPAKLTKHISAFANADGGELYIGIAENNDKKPFLWNGFGKQEDANGHIQAISDILSLTSDVSMDFLQANGENGLVLHVVVQKSLVIVYASDKIAYIRQSAQSIPMNTSSKQRQLEYNKGIATYVDKTVDAPINVITESLVTLKFMTYIESSLSPIDWFRSQMLIRSGKPTVSGLLLFANEPQAFLPKRSAIKIIKYNTSDIEGSRATEEFPPITIEGCIYNQIYSAVNKVVELIEKSPIIRGEQFESAVYPRETLHEIITNAVLHRDYSIPSDVQVRIYDNRIEIESPGVLPGFITLRNILKRTFSRNAPLVRIINKFENPPNRDIGEGLNTAFRAMRQMLLKDPIISQEEYAVKVTINHEPLATKEKIIMEYLDDNESINNATARDICHDTADAVKHAFDALIRSKMIERIPDLNGKAAAYRRVGAEPEES